MFAPGLFPPTPSVAITTTTTIISSTTSTITITVSAAGLFPAAAARALPDSPTAPQSSYSPDGLPSQAVKEL